MARTTIRTCTSPTTAVARTIDHLTPLSKGGGHTRANVATACRHCNIVKGDRLAGDQLALL
ncbi:HNH endonuclease [Gordonia hongkongensis]|uniref:HNH endonuclease n=1 Tax=Gordonia hongkongensis TaxID=1701090 RepID=UPI003D0FB923